MSNNGNGRKFCGNCGTPANINDIRCSRCGAFFPDSSAFNSNNSGEFAGSAVNNYSPTPVVNITQTVADSDEESAGGKLAAVLKVVLAVLLSIVLLLGSIVVYNYTGYRAVINRFDKYFDNMEYNRIVDCYSMAVFYNADPERNYEELDDEAQRKIERIYYYFNEELGINKYPLSFKTVKNNEMSGREFEDFMDSIEYPDKEDVINNARNVEVEITASANGRKAYKRIRMILTLEDDNNWKIYSFEEI